MGNGSRLPRRFTYGQTIMWIANSIGHFMSLDHLVAEMWHLTDHEHRAEPDLRLISGRLGFAYLDDPSLRESRYTVGTAVWQAEQVLYEVLCDGRVTVTGLASWEQTHLTRPITALECSNLRFCADEHGITKAVVITKQGLLWGSIRFDSAEIAESWKIGRSEEESGYKEIYKENDATSTKGSSTGRGPSLMPDIEDALRFLYPDGEPKSIRRQEMLEKVKKHSGLPASESTLDRARKKIWPR